MHPGAFDPARPAIVVDGSGETVTFGELDTAATRIARLFADRGLEPGDHVALCLENSARFLELLWGARYAGLLYTACSTRLTSAELAYIVDDCGARAVVMSARFAERAPAVARAATGVEHRFALGGAIEGHERFEEAVAEQSAEPLAPGRRAGTDMLYSSGTTGRPKGIRPRDLDATIDEPMLVTGVIENALGFGEGDVYLSPAPLYHAAPLRFCMSVHQLGGTVVLMERFDAAAYLRLVGEHRVTHSQLVPTMFVRLLRVPEPERAAADVSSLRAVVHAAAPCPVAIKQQMIDWWGPIVHEYYASTEGCGLTWVTSPEWLSHPGTVGRALLGLPRIVGDDGTELPAGQDGAVYFSDGPQFEYHNDPEKTAAAYDDRGWATCGDIGHLDEDGFLYLVDRASYTIITGGVNVYPQEAEDVLISHPDVMDAAVFGVPDEEFGERVHAVVQPAAGLDQVDTEALAAALDAHCREHLADVKCPRGYDFRAELPRHDTGKLYKRKLKDEYAARS